jgi:hypothetical protein
MDIKAGYVVFARTNGIMGKLIRVGEWLKLRRCEWNHMAIVDRLENGEWYVIQATLKGVTNTARLVDVAPGGSYIVVVPPPEVDLDKVVVFAEEQVGVCYGMGTILAISIDILTYQWVPALRGARKNSWICSALGAEALRFGGWFHSWVDLYTVVPEDAFETIIAEGGAVLL